MVFIESTTETEEMRELSKHLGENSSQPTTMADLAYLLLLMGDYGRTISFCQKLLSEISDNWPLVIRCYSIMGQAYKNVPELALKSFENALELQLRYNTTDFNTLATMYNNIGWAHRQLASATHLIVDNYEKALKMCRAVSDSKIDWCLMATIINNLVTSQPDADIDLALKRERFVLDIRLRYLPLSHPLVAVTHQTLAEIYSTRGEFEEASVHTDEALRIKLKYLPQSHPSIASGYSAAAQLYLDKGDYEATKDQKEMSEESYNKSIDLIYQAFDVLSSRELSSSINYVLISYLYNNCGVVYTRLGRFDEALDCFNTATNTSLRHVPVNNDLHGAALKNKGKVFTLQGNMSKGMEYYKLSIDFYNQTGLSNSLRMAQIYFNIGEWYEISEDHELAVAYYERAVDIGAKTHRPGHPFRLQYKKALDKLKSTVITGAPIKEASWF